MAVASYAILLLAGVRVFEGGEGRGALPLPKWQHKGPGDRLSTPELLRELRGELWAHALEHLPLDAEHFVNDILPVTKCPEVTLPVASAVLYAATG